jgi:hypothetical protein
MRCPTTSPRPRAAWLLLRTPLAVLLAQLRPGMHTEATGSGGSSGARAPPLACTSHVQCAVGSFCAEHGVAPDLSTVYRCAPCSRTLHLAQCEALAHGGDCCSAAFFSRCPVLTSPLDGGRPMRRDAALPMYTGLWPARSLRKTQLRPESGAGRGAELGCQAQCSDPLTRPFRPYSASLLGAVTLGGPGPDPTATDAEWLNSCPAAGQAAGGSQQPPCYRAEKQPLGRTCCADRWRPLPRRCGYCEYHDECAVGEVCTIYHTCSPCENENTMSDHRRCEQYTVDHDCCSAEFFKQCPARFSGWYPQSCGLPCAEPEPVRSQLPLRRPDFVVHAADVTGITLWGGCSCHAIERAPWHCLLVQDVLNPATYDFHDPIQCQIPATHCCAYRTAADASQPSEAGSVRRATHDISRTHARTSVVASHWLPLAATGCHWLPLPPRFGAVRPDRVLACAPIHHHQSSSPRGGPPPALPLLRAGHPAALRGRANPECARRVPPPSHTYIHHDPDRK